MILTAKSMRAPRSCAMKPLALLLFALGGCCTTPRIEATPPAPFVGELLDAEALPQQVLWRQRVTAFWGESESQGFDAVVQRVDDSLTLLGLSPTGAMGFAIVLKGGEVELTNNMPQELPFAASNVLLDVQRAFYPWLAKGVLEGELNGEQITERWSHGKLQERTFTRLDGELQGELTIRYEWGDSKWTTPRLVKLDNGWFGYRLEIETQDETLLDEVEGK
jgi:hypothetical protein